MKNGDLCAIATSKWALIDIRSRKMARLTEDIISKYELEEKDVFSIKELNRLKEPNNYSSSIFYTVKRKDIDLNNHMHNLYYLDLAYEALPEEVYQQRPFDNVRITYKKEITLGETVLCKYAKTENKHIIVIKDKNDEIVHSIIELE